MTGLGNPVSESHSVSAALAFTFLGRLGGWGLAPVQGLSDADTDGYLHPIHDDAMSIIRQHGD